jgi:hypothetical protein
MARKQKREDVSVKIDAKIHRKLKVIAAIEGRDIAEILSEIAEPVVDRRYAKHFKNPPSESE